jgi:hypothetical protein
MLVGPSTMEMTLMMVMSALFFEGGVSQKD